MYRLAIVQLPTMQTQLAMLACLATAPALPAQMALQTHAASVLQVFICLAQPAQPPVLLALWST